MTTRIALSLALSLGISASTACAPASPDDAPESAVGELLYDGVTTLPIEGTLAFNQCSDPERGTCGAAGRFLARSRTATVSFNGSNALRRVVPGARVRVGPFHLRRSVRNLGPGTDASTTYRIRVLARSPAAYGAMSATGAPLLGASPTLTVIGSRDVVISSLSAQQDVYVDATLPSVFSAVQAVGEIAPSSTTLYARTSWPSACASLPASQPAGVDVGAISASLDGACFQAVVAPTGILQPRYLPVSVLYEPPGNCSWASLTQQNIAGSLHGVTQERDVLTSVTRDVGFFWNRQQTHTEAQATSATQRAVEFRVVDVSSAGTRLGLPLASPGDARCNMPGTVIPPRPDAGPGRGDVFFFVRDPQLLAWSSAGSSNATLLPSSAASVLHATAYSIATGVGLPTDVQFTDAERRALLALDPYIDPVNPFVLDASGRVIDVRVISKPTLDARRFVSMNHTVSVTAGLGWGQTSTSELRLSTGQTLTDATRSFVTSSPDDPTLTFVSAGLQSTAGGIATAAANLVPLPGFGAIVGQIIDGILPFYVDRTTVNTVSTLTGIRRSEVSAATGVTQQFHMQDTARGMTARLYFDRVFGTYLLYDTQPQPLVSLRNRLTGKCMDVADGSRLDQARVNQYDCHGGANQRWYFYTVPGTTRVQVINDQSARCIDIPNGATTGGEALQQYGCHSGGSQQFDRVAVGASIALRRSGTNLCVEASPTGANSSQLRQVTCTFSSQQLWNLTP